MVLVVLQTTEGGSLSKNGTDHPVEQGQVIFLTDRVLLFSQAFPTTILWIPGPFFEKKISLSVYVRLSTIVSVDVSLRESVIESVSGQAITCPLNF